MPQQKHHPSRPILFLLSLIFSCAILVSSASSFLAPINLKWATLANPLNVEASVKLLIKELSTDPESIRLAALNKMARHSIALNAKDARLYSVLGTIEERQGNVEFAQQLYKHSLKLLPTEIHALSQRFAYNANNGNPMQAISIADVMLRRWPKYWDMVKPHIPYLLQNQDAYQEAKKRFSNNYAKHRLISSLTGNKASLAIAYRLVSEWHKSGAENLRPTINILTQKLTASGEEFKAYLLFRQTLNKEQMAELGYVHNGAFKFQTTGNLFDWILIKRAGVNMSIKDIQSGDNEKSRSFEVKFRDTPTRLTQLLQTLILPNSNFRFTATYSTRNLKAPKPIKLAVECAKGGKSLAVLEFYKTNEQNQTQQVSFKVPAENCTMQRIRIYNDNLIDSWKNRYSGSLLFHKISIELQGV